MKRCARCLTGTVAVVAFITDPEVVLKILSHLHLPTEVPSPSPARRSSMFDALPIDEEKGSEVPWEIVESGSDEDPRTRAPP